MKRGWFGLDSLGAEVVVATPIQIPTEFKNMVAFNDA